MDKATGFFDRIGQQFHIGAATRKWQKKPHLAANAVSFP